MPAADLEEALQKKGGLTLEQLMIYDDIATDALVDRVYFWSTIRKARPNTRPSRGIREDQVCQTLQRMVIVEKDAAAAQTAILRQYGIVAFMRTLHTADEQEHFERHLRKYINIYLPECPFEVCTTYRYTIVNAEACVIARKPIKAGDSIKYLTGIQVELTEEEEQGLSSRTDFSIVLSSRRKRPSLFLGPARFANHDCDSNARLTTTGAHGLSIVARRSIALGEEITVTYGEDYFGIDNCECLCGTCERLVRNGWDPRGPLLRSNDEEEKDDGTGLWPRKRQRLDPIRDGPGAAQRTVSSFYASTFKTGLPTPNVQSLIQGQSTGPRKRGRPRKHPLPTDRVDVAHTNNARDVLSRWFGLHEGQAGFELDSDLIHVKTKYSRPASRDEYTDADIPADKRHYKKTYSAYELMADRGANQLRDLSKKLSIMNSMTATLLNTTAVDVEKYYYPPGHVKHVPLPTPPPSEDTSPTRLKREPLEDLTTRADSLGLPPFATVNEPFALTGGRPVSRQQASSPLRKVTTAVQVQTMEELPVQAGVDPPKRKRGRPRKHPRPEDLLPQATNREATNVSASTEVSSTSSTFSVQRQLDHSTPETSVSGAERFASGNICQNIVEMFTSESPGDADTQSSGHKRQTRSIAHDETEVDGTTNADGTINSIEGRAKSRGRSQASGENTDDTEERRGPPRTPGDYHMTPALLIDINDRWIECRNCDEYFVQHDAYLTRIACPRCERHSKLYGYHWPKTDKIGRDDREERVLDHRLIHRFIEPEEERLERKGRKTLYEALKDRELSSSQEVDPDERGGSRDDSRRRSRRVFTYA